MGNQVSEHTEQEHPTGIHKKYPRWIEYIPGALGAIWLVASLGYVFRAKVLSPGLSVLGKGLVAAICLSGLIFVASSLQPLRGRRIQAGEIADMWSFLRGAPPTDSAQYALWRKFRRTIAILIATLVLIALFGLVASLGLARA